jgi:hypothetical protein
MADTLALLLACNLPPFIEWHERDRRGWTGWLTHVHRAAARRGARRRVEPVYLSRTVPTYTAWQRIDALTPPDSVVLTFPWWRPPVRHPRLWSDATLATDVVGSAGGRRVAHAGGRRASRPDTRAVRTRTAAMPSSSGWRSPACVRQCCLEPLYEDARVVLYRFVVPADAESAHTRR